MTDTPTTSSLVDPRRVEKRAIGCASERTRVELLNRFTLPDCHVDTAEDDSYNGLERSRSTAAREDDGDGILEAYINTPEGMWTGLRNYLRQFRGVHKNYLSGYIALHECSINLKPISRTFIAALVKVHSFNS
jgi:hypothetical protein